MDTETKDSISDTAVIIPSIALLQQWLDTRDRHIAEFRERAQQWIEHRPERSLIWPQDQAAIVALGVPCDDCLQIVDRLPDGRHAIRCIVLGSRHWADGITAQCGGCPPWSVV